MENQEIKRIDVVIDSDAKNEIDDQFAIGYLLAYKNELNTVALYASPFANRRCGDPREGMKQSYDEIIKLLHLAKREDLIPVTFKGAEGYIQEDMKPIISDASLDLSKRAMNYTKENPLVVVAIGCITNVASAILLNPEIAERIRLIWLAGQPIGFPRASEFNLMQDWRGARLAIESVGSYTQIPCMGVASGFLISRHELEYYLFNKNPFADYVARNTFEAIAEYAPSMTWDATRALWDVLAVAVLLTNTTNRKFLSIIQTKRLIPTQAGQYDTPLEKEMDYVYALNRDALMNDLLRKLYTF